MRREADACGVAKSQLDQGLGDCVEPCGALPVTLKLTG